MKRPISVLALALAVSVVAGCGGGGGGNGNNTSGTPSVTISSANATQVAAAAIETAQVDDAAGLGGGLLSDSTSASAQAARQAGQRRAVAQREIDIAEGCDFNPGGGGQGSFTGRFNDADNSSTLSRGDSASVTFNNCYFLDEQASFNGTSTLRINSISGDPLAPGSTLDLTMTFGNLAVSGVGDDDATLNGDMIVSFSDTASTSRVVISGGSLRVQDSSDTVTISNPNLTFDAAASGRYSVFGDATVSSSDLGGVVTIEIPAATPLTGFGENDPDGGSMTIRGVSSNMVLTVTGANAVRLDIDTSGDGVTDESRTVTWDEITI